MFGSFANIDARKIRAVGISFASFACRAVVVAMAFGILCVAQLKFDVIWNFIRVKVRKSFVRSVIPSRPFLFAYSIGMEENAGAEFKFGKFYRKTPFALFCRFVFASSDGHPYSTSLSLRTHGIPFKRKYYKTLARWKWLDIIKANARDGSWLSRFHSHR